MQISVATDRLRIRPLLEDDAPFILQLLNSEGWLRYIGDRKVRSLLDAKKYISEVSAKTTYFFHVFTLKNADLPLGIITYIKRPELPDYDLGFAILPEYSNKGYTQEAATEIMKEIRKNNRHEFLYAITLPDNKKSIRLLQKLGMSYKENILTDDIELAVYSIPMKKTQEL